MEFVDIAGLVKGASRGEGLGNQFLANIREVDAIVHVVRCFEDANVVHVDGSVDPLRDIETIDLELIFADLEVLERRMSKTGKSARMDKTAAKEFAMQERLKKHLEDAGDAILFELENEEEKNGLRSTIFWTAKPVIYALMWRRRICRMTEFQCSCTGGPEVRRRAQQRGLCNLCGD